MKRIQIYLLISMVLLFFVYAGLDMYAYPLSKFAENVMQSMFAIILLLIDPKGLLSIAKGDKDEILPSNSGSMDADSK